MQYQEVIEQLMDQAITEILGEGVYRVSTKTIDSVDDLIATLANARSLTTAANQNVGVVGNSIIMGMGAYTGGNSAIQYGMTTNRKAKALYALSTIFSASAIASGGLIETVEIKNLTPKHLKNTSKIFFKESCNFLK
jgi:hypothetical protein